MAYSKTYLDKTTIYTADDEEPDCMKCDNVCASDSVCNICGPDGAWCNYKRTDINEN